MVFEGAGKQEQRHISRVSGPDRVRYGWQQRSTWNHIGLTVGENVVVRISIEFSTGMFCRVLTDRYRRYFTSVSTDRSPQFSSVRPQYPTEISQNVRYSPSTLQRFYRKFGTLPVPYRDFTDSSVLLQYPTEKFCSVRPQHPTEISQIVRYSSSTLQRFHR